MVLKHETLEQSILHKFLTFISGFASAFIAMNLYFDAVTREEDTRKYLANKTVDMIHGLWLRPNNDLSGKFDYLGTLPSEMYPQLNIQNKSDMEKTVMAINIFQNLENYKVLYDQNPRELSLWLCHFLQWMQSTTLQNIWPKLKHNYKPSTIVFVEFLFKHANELKSYPQPLTSENYIAMSRRIRDEAKKILK